MSDKRLYSTGRRKTSVARVWLKPGSGNIIVNGLPVQDYFRRETLVLQVKQPLETINASQAIDIEATVKGGGWSGQAGAVKLGIARCLQKQNPANTKPLRSEGFLTRDSREVERKKYGRKKARKRFQFSKR